MCLTKYLEAKENGPEALSRAEETLNTTVTTSADCPREATETSQITESNDIPGRQLYFPGPSLSS